MISSAHKRAGLLYERFNLHYGKDDAGVLAIKGTTFQFNPLADKALIEADIAKDPQRYSAEYLSEWRDDLAGFVGRDLLDAAVDVGVTVRPYVSGVYYFAYLVTFKTPFVR